MRLILLLGLSLSVLACQGGRYTDAASRSDEARQSESTGEPGRDVLLDPAASLLEPTGLGYRVDTYFGQGDDVIHQVAYGIDALPVGVDVDGDSSTGNLLGADISVHFFTLLLYAQVTIEPLDGAPEPMPLRVEVSVLDPRNLLGLPGLLGVVDPDLRIALGMDASEVSAPSRFYSQLTVLDSLFEFLPRFTSASLSTEVDGATGRVGAILAMYADKSGTRADALNLNANSNPGTNMDIEVTLAPDAETSSVNIDISAPAEVGIAVESFDGLQDQETARRDIELRLNQLDQQLTLSLNGVDGLNGLDGVDTQYLLSTSTPIENMSLRLLDKSASGDTGEAYALLSPLPEQLEVVQAADGGLSMNASARIDDLIFAQSENAEIILSAELDPETAFSRHIIRQYESSLNGRDVELMQVRLGGLSTLEAEFGDVTLLSAKLAPAPLSLREESADGFQEAIIDRLPGEFSLAFPDTERQLDLSYSANESGPGLSYREQNNERSTQASIRPLPTSLNLCSSGNDECGSHGTGTDTSLLFEASESLTINYQQQSTDGREQIAIENFQVQKLQFDLGIRSGGKRGYVFFDTDSHAFSGNFWQIDGDDGVALRFSEGSFAEDRYLEYDDYILIEERSGAMRCPGRHDLEIRTSGRWIDADFILDQLCQ